MTDFLSLIVAPQYGAFAGDGAVAFPAIEDSDDIVVRGGTWWGPKLEVQGFN
jgi:hypothetical protein